MSTDDKWEDMVTMAADDSASRDRLDRLRREVRWNGYVNIRDVEWLMDEVERLRSGLPEPKSLRDIARALDHLDKLASMLLDPIVRGQAAHAERSTVTVELDIAGEPISPEEAASIQDWLAGDAMQRDLRGWADTIEANR